MANDAGKSEEEQIKVFMQGLPKGPHFAVIHINAHMRQIKKMCLLYDLVLDATNHAKEEQSNSNIALTACARPREERNQGSKDT